MPRVVKEAVVRASVERVFRALVEERAAWMTSFREEPLRVPLAVGARIPATRVGSTSGSRYEFVVTALEPPRRLVLEVVRNGKPAATGSFELEATPDGTRVRDVAEFELSGLQRMMALVVAVAMERQLDAELAALKRHAERAP